MIGNISGVKKVDFPYQLINSLDGAKPAKVSDVVIKGMRSYYSNKDYRDRIGTLYDKLQKIRPNDNINRVLYTDNYIERGVAVKGNVPSFKQTWTEYRLMYNEKKERKEESMNSGKTFDSGLDLFNLDSMTNFNFESFAESKKEEPIEEKKEEFKMPEFTPSFDFGKEFTKNTNTYGNTVVNTDSYIMNNFDDIFERLSKRVDGFNHYIEELKAKKEELSSSSTLLEMNRQQFEQEKKNFEQYKEEETKRIEQEKETLENNYKRFQSLVDGINDKINGIMG